MPMPIVAAAIFAIASHMVVKVLLTLGIGFVTYQGFDYALGEIETFLNTQYSGIAPNMFAIMEMCGFTTGFSMLISSYSAYVGIKVAMGLYSRFRILPI